MDDIDVADTDAMAQAMGFSSFGAQNPPNKRRRYNPRVDGAIVGGGGGTPSTSLPLHGHNSRHDDQGRGANATPLGTRTAPNQDEIVLEDDDDDDHNDEEGEAAAAAPPAGEGQDDGSPGGPRYVDTSRPSRPLDPASLGHHAVVVGGPAPASLRGGHPRSGPVGGGHRGHGAQPWWDDYYDPTANMNPWDKLEREKGLEPTNSSWLTWDESKAKWARVQKSRLAPA